MSDLNIGVHIHINGFVGISYGILQPGRFDDGLWRCVFQKGSVGIGIGKRLQQVFSHLRNGLPREKIPMAGTEENGGCRRLWRRAGQTFEA